MSKPPRAGEFEIISRVFAPLASGAKGAYGLTDDAAVLDIDPGRQLIVTTDTLVAGVHFPDDAVPGETAARLLRVNLSDLAAMGAVPFAYTLSMALDRAVDDEWLDQFGRSLATEQEKFGLRLVGGDTVSQPGPLTLTLTAMGTVATGTALLRSSAKPGDRIYVSGTIGDSALGLMALRDELPGMEEGHRKALMERYKRPRPRVDLGQGLVGLANGCVDVSDGLIADLGHMTKASRTTATVEAALVPLSPGARAALAADGDLLPVILGGGDDYELLFTAPAEAEAEIDELSRRQGLPLTAIGHMSNPGADPVKEDQPGKVTVIDPKGNMINLKKKGFQHF